MLTAVAGRRWIIGHGFCLAVMKCAQSTECCTALGKFISLAIDKGFQEGLEAGIEHGKASKSLSKVAAYDSGWESLKDSPFELLMFALTLEGGHGDEDPTLEFRGSLVVAGPLALGVANVDGTLPLHDDMFDATILDKPSDY
ncbi:hypothetical protein Tco_0722792 [Tanacetum coccineum]